jgi:DNA-binding beta-propeller fold protein YncE
VSIGVDRATIGALSLAALLCGCAIGPTGSASSASLPLVRVLSPLQSLMPTGQPRIEPFGDWMYTAQLYGEDLGVYRRKGLSLSFHETLSNGVSAPQGTDATIDGWWYVANGGRSNVLVYRSTNKGPTGPVATLDDFGEFPANVDVTPSRRLVAVSNYKTMSGGAGSVTVYRDRQAEPSRTLTYGNDPIEGSGVTIDHLGNCYWSFNDPNTDTGSIVEFAHCSGKGHVVVPKIASAGGIVFDQGDNLYYIDRVSGIYKCKLTSQCALFSTGFGLPVNVNFDVKQKYLWVADATGYIDAVDATTGQIVYRTQAEGGPTDPPFGIAPAPGG